MPRLLVPALALVIGASAAFDLVDALGAFSGRAPDTVNWLSAIGGLAFWASTILCVVFAIRRKQLAFVWMLAPVCGSLVAAGYYVHTAPYCSDCRDATTFPRAEPWVFAVAGVCIVAGAVAAKWRRIGTATTALALLATFALTGWIGVHTIS